MNTVNEIKWIRCEIHATEVVMFCSCSLDIPKPHEVYEKRMA